MITKAIKKINGFDSAGFEGMDKDGFNDYWFSDIEIKEILQLRLDALREKRKRIQQATQYSPAQVKINRDHLTPERLANLQLFRNTHDEDWHILLKFGIVKND